MPFDGAVENFIKAHTPRFSPELQPLYDKVRRATADRRVELGLRKGQWYERWPSFAALDADFERVRVPGCRRFPAPMVNGFIDTVDDGSVDDGFNGIGRRVRDMKCEHGADTIRLVVGGRKRRVRGGGPINAITPPNVVAIGLARTRTTAFNVTVIHSEDTFDFYCDSVGGNDGNDGLSPATAWKTPGRVQTASAGFSAGDRMGFKRGSVFSSGYTPQSSGSSGNPIVYGAYDAGVIPRFDANHGGSQMINMSNKNFVEFENQRWEQFDGGAADFTNCDDCGWLNVDVREFFSSNGIRLLAGSDNATIDGGVWSDNGPTGADGHAVEIRATSFTTVQNALLERNSGDSIQGGNEKPVRNVTVDNCTGKNNGEDFIDVKDGPFFISDCTGLRDGVGGFSRRTPLGIEKGLVFHDQSSDNPASHTVADTVIKGWRYNQVWLDDGEHTVTLDRVYCDDDAGLGVFDIGHCFDINGNAGQESTVTLRASLIVGRNSNRVPLNCARGLAVTLQHVTTVHTQGSQDVMDQNAECDNVLTENCIFYHKGTGLALDFNSTADNDGIDNSVFDTGGGTFVAYGGTNYSSGQAGSFNGNANVSANVFGDPQFVDDDGFTIASFLPNAAGTAHQLGKAGVTTLDINGDPFNVTNPTAGCLQI